MKRVLRFLICFVSSFAALYLSGYGNLMNDISPSLVATTFIGSVLVLSVVVTLVWETYLNCKNKINELSYRIEKLEEENERLKSGNGSSNS